MLRTACPYSATFPKRKIYILWTDIDILKEYIPLLKSKIKYVVLNNKISNYLESKKINHYKFKDHIEDKKEQELLEKQHLKELEKEMLAAVKKLEFEKAALLRDQISFLKDGGKSLKKANAGGYSGRKKFGKRKRYGKKKP